MAGLRGFVLWEKSIRLVAEGYRLSAAYPQGERFGMTAQLRRAALSIASNVAEGNGRAYPKDYMRFLSIARGSLKEVETILEVSRLLGYSSPDSLETAMGLADEVSRMLTSMRKRLNADLLQSHNR